MQFLELLGGHAEDHVVYPRAFQEEHATQASLLLKTEPLVQTQRRLVKTVYVGVHFLVASLAKKVAQQKQDRLGGVALAVVFAADT